jgi:hypothetical protein
MGTFLRKQNLTATNSFLRISRAKLSKAVGYFVCSLLALSAQQSSAQISVTATAGAASGSYTTVKEAVDSINSGWFQGAIAITCSAGSETNAGSAPIVLNGSGIGLALYSSVSIIATTTYTINAGAGGVGTPATAVTDGIFALNGANNVTIENITFTDGNAINPATMEYGLGFFKASNADGCQFNTVKNCTFNMRAVNAVAGTLPNPDGSVGILVTNAIRTTATTPLTGVLSTGANSSNTFQGNTINFANTGIAIMGFASINNVVGDASNIIGGASVAQGNRIINFGGGAGATVPCAGIRLLNQWDYNIQNDTVNNNNGTAGSGSHLGIVRGIFVQSHPDAIGSINNNTVTVKNGAVANVTSGIEVAVSPSFTSIGGALGSSLSISNNLITGCAILQGTTGAFNAIWVNLLVPATLNMNSNNFLSNTSAATTGATNLIYNQTTTAHNATAVNINNNTFGNGITRALTFNGTAAYTGVMYAIWDNRTFSPTVATVPIPDASYSYNIFNNSFGTPVFPKATGAWYYVSTGQVFNTVTPLSKTVRMVGNQITNIAVGHSGSTYVLYPFSAGATVSTVIDSNLISNYRRTDTAAAGLWYGMFGNLYYHGPNATTSVRYNTVTGVNCPTLGTSGFYGLYLSQFTTNSVYNGAITFTNNNITNNFHNGSLTGTNYGVFCSGYGPGSQFSNNIVNDNRVGGAFYGVYSSSTGNPLATVVCANNQVQRDTSNSPTSIMGGIYSFAGYTLNMYNNNVHRLHRVGVPTGATDLMYGIYNSAGAGTISNIYNNFVSDFRIAAAPTVPGFSRNVGAYLLGTGTNNFYHNTIKLDSAGLRPQMFNGATGILYGATFASLSQANIYNNIVDVNQLSFGTASQVSAIRRAFGGTANTATLPVGAGSAAQPYVTLNNNIYYVPVDSQNYYYSEGNAVNTLVNGFRPFDGTTASGLANSVSNLVIDTNFNTSCGSYKRFMSLGSRESATFRDSNLVALGTTPPTFAPAGVSFAENNALPTSIPVGITSDYNAVSRATNPDCGALQFAGTGTDLAGPAISFTPLANTVCDNNPILPVTITDASGILSTTPGTKPRLYFKKSTNTNALAATNTVADDGWKWVEASNSTSPYSFTINYGLLFNTGAAAAGDIIQYFVVAQDGSALNNLGNSGVSFAAGTCPDSVQLLASAFPVTGFNSFTLLTQPTSIATLANPGTLCGSGTTALALNTNLNGATYQWQVLNASSIWVNIPGATNATYTPPSAITNSTSFRAQVFCNGTPIVPASPTQAVTVQVYNPQVASSTGATRCGAGVVNLTATPSVGDTIKWFAAATGGLPVATGNAYNPSVLATTNFFVGSFSPLGAHILDQVNNITYFTSVSQYSQEIEIVTAGGAWLDSVQMGFNNTTAGTIQIQIYDSAGSILRFTGPSTTVSVPTVLTTNVAVPLPATHLRSIPVGTFLPAGKYRITTAASPTSSPFYNFFSTPSYTFPMSTAAPGIARINVGAASSLTGAPSASQERFLKYWLRASCVSSPRVAVAATVTPPPVVTVTRTPATGSLCIGSTLTLVASSIDTGYSYAWTPLPVTATGTKFDTAKITVTSAKTYTCTATNTATGCGFVATVPTTVFAPPPFIGLGNANPSVCSGGSSVLSIVDSSAGSNNPLPSGYCVPTYAQSGTTQDFINNVTLAGSSGTLISNLASGDGVAGCSAAGCDYYAYPGTFPTVYTGSTIPVLLPGATYTITAQAGTAFNQGFRIYLDYNRDGIFQASEELMNFASSTAVNTGTFTVPLVTSQGRTMMRVQCRYNNIPLPTEVCAVPGFGETEDYEVKLGFPNSPATAVTWASNPTATTTQVTPPSNFTVSAGPITATTTFTATVSDANGCTVTTTTIVNVGPMACGPITTNKPTSCPCSPVTLTASATGGSAPYSYEWYNGATLLGTNQTLNVSPCVTTTYSVIVRTTVAGCLDSCTQTFTQNVAPPVTLTAVNAAGGVIQICGNTQSSVNVNAGGATTYSFTPTTNVTPTMGAGPFTFNPISTSVYTMTGADVNGCTATTLVTINYRKKDTIEIRANPGVNICATGCVTLSVTDTVYGADNIPVYCVPTVGISGQCITKVQVGSLNNLTAPTCALPAYNAYTAGSLSGGAYVNLVKGSSPNITVDVPSSGYVSCWLDANRNGSFEAGEYTSVVVVNPTGTVALPIPGGAVEGLTMLRVRSSSNALAAADTCTSVNVLDGETEDYLVRIIRVQTPIVSQTWATPFPNIAGTVLTTSTSNPTVACNLTGLSVSIGGVPTTANIFQVTATDANGCTNQTTLAVNRAPLSTNPITANATTRCSGQLLQLTANPIGGGMPYTYSWQDTSGVIGTSKVLTTTPTNTTTAAIVNSYTVTITDACAPSASISTVINITVNPRPTVQFSVGNQPICNGTGVSNILINNAGSTSVTSFSTVNTIIPTGPFSPGAGAGPFQWPVGGVPAAGATTYTITGTNSTTGCTNTTALTLAYSPVYGTNAIVNPTSLGSCGGTVTLTTNDTTRGDTTLPCISYPAASHGTANSPITNVTFGTINNSSSSVAALPSVTYYPPSPTTTTTVIAGVATPMSVSLGGQASISVWIDWNRNCALEPTEHWQVAGTTATTVPPISATGVTGFPITIPATALPGLTKMRIRTRTISSPNGPNEATTQFFSGETEEYDITILAAPALPIVTYCWSYIDSNTTLQSIGCGRPYPNTPIAKAPGVTYTVTATNSVGCTRTSTVFLAVGPISCNPVTVWKDTVCFNQCDTLTANQSGGGSPFTYAWTGPGISGSTSTKKITVCPTYTASAGIDSFTYTCVITDACGTTCTSTRKIYMRPGLSLSVLPNGSDTACGNTSKTFAATPSTYSAYTWSGPGVASVTGASITTLVSTSGRYIVTAVGAGGCTITASDSVTHSAAVTTSPSANPSSLGCNGTTTLSTIDSTLGTGPQTDPNCYAATTAIDNLSGDHIRNVVFPVAATPQISNPTGACAGTPTAYCGLQVQPTPTVIAGQTYTLSMSVNNGGTEFGGYWIDWNRNCTFEASEYVNVPLTLGGSGTYDGSAIVLVPVNATAGVTRLRVRSKWPSALLATEATVTNPVTYAFGEVEDYLINVIGNVPITTNTHVWNGGSLVNVPGNPVPTGTISVTTPYTVTSTNSFGCTTTASVTVNVSTLACGAITTPSTSVCSGVPFVLTANPIGGGVPYTYSWSPSSPVVTTKNDTVIAINPGSTNITNTYDVTITDACGTTCSTTISITVRPAPTATITPAGPINVCNGATTASLSATTASLNSTVASVTWLAPAGASVAPTTGLTTTATVPPAGIFSVVATDALGCAVTSTVLINYAPNVLITPFANPTNLGNCAATVNLGIFPDNVVPGYCVPTVNSDDYSEIMSFGLGTSLATPTNLINNVTGCGVVGGGAANGLPASIVSRYNNYSNLPYSSTPMSAGGKYYLTYSIDTCYFAQGINYPYYASVWIDLNRDGDFNDLGEQVHAPTTVTPGSYTKIDSFTINPAANVISGRTIMRVTVANNGALPIGSGLSCGTFADGETEDYSVLLGPTGLTYAWTASTGGGLVTTTGASVTATPSGQPAYTYSVTATNSFGCTTLGTVVVTANAFVLDSVTNKGRTTATAICKGKCDTVRVYRKGGLQPYTATFSPTTNVTMINDSMYAVCPSTTTTYTVTYADACGTSDSKTVTINIRNLPSVTFTPDSVVACSAPASLNIPLPVAPSCVSSSWSPSGPPGIITLSTPTTYTYTCVDGFGCTNTATFRAIVNFPHNIVTKATPDTVCYGSTTSLSFTDSTINTGPQVDPNCYTPTTTMNNSLGEEITNVTFPVVGTPRINNSTGACLVSTPTGYCGLQASVVPTVISGSSYQISLTVNNGGLEFGGAWFDWNRNCTFEPSEYVNIPLTLTTSYTGTATVLVPTIGVVPGYVRMRVRSKFATPLTATEAVTISSTAFGETEDYLINVIAAGPAPVTSYKWVSANDSIGGTGAPAPQTTSSLTASAVYTLTVVSNGGCTYTSTKAVNVRPQIVHTETVVDSPSCYGYTTGKIATTATGGTGSISTQLFSVANGLQMAGVTPYSNLAAGVYKAVYTDAAGCKDSAQATINQPDSLTVSVGFTGATCNGSSDGIAFGIVTGGTPTYSYAWTDTLGNTLTINTTSAAGDTIYNLASGSYCLYVYDAKACIAIKCFTITQAPALVLSVDSVDDVLCKGGNTGVITLATTGGVPGYKYNLGSGPFLYNGGVFSGLTAGSYTLVVNDSTGVCTDTVIATVGEPSAALAISAITLVDTNKCFGDATTDLVPSASGGTAPYVFTYSNSTSGDTAKDLAANSYTVTVTDKNNCTASSVVVVNAPSAVVISNAAITHVSCNGSSNGSVMLTISGGTPAASAPLYNVSPSTSGLAMGAYTFTVNDANSCAATTSVAITEPPVLDITSVSVTPTKCNGSSDGTAKAIVTGGTGTYSYEWKNAGGSLAATSDSVSGLSAGTYTVIVSSPAGCIDSLVFAIIQPSSIAISGAVVQNESCFNACDGILNVTGSGGVGTYQYNLNGTGWVSADTFKTLCDATYTIAVRDANVICTATTVLTITGATSPVSVTATADSMVKCNGQANGGATATATGGTGATYTYSWADSTGVISSSASATGLAAGTYTVTASNGNACTASTTVTISQPDTLVASASVTTQIACNAGNAVITVSAMGGMINYIGVGTYTVSAGTYTYNVSDANGCTSSTTVNVTAPTAVSIDSTNSTMPTCNGLADGKLCVATVSGGNAPYKYLWSNGDTVSCASNLAAGTYSVIVTDANACSATKSFVLGAPSALVIDSIVVAPLDCSSTAGGSAIVYASGGTGTYTYVWQSNASVINNATGYAAGTYSVQVSDANSCSVVGNFTIIQGLPISVDSSSTTMPTCSGLSNGKICVVTVNGGTMPYKYTWNNGDTTACLNNIAAGTYSVVVTDANSCTATMSYLLGQPNALVIDSIVVAPLNCASAAGGAATIYASGGTGTYTYVWQSNASVIDNATGYAAGTYTAQVSDVNTCSAVGNFTISQGQPISIDSITITDVTCFGDSNGSAAVVTVTPSDTYTYQWSSNASATASATDYKAGTYTLTVTGSNGCSVTSAIVIGGPSAALVASASATTPLCSDDTVTITITSTGGNTGTVTGTGTYTVNVNGTYTYTVTDSKGCAASTTVVIALPTAVTISNVAVTDVLCYGGSTGSVVITANGGTLAGTYNITPATTGLAEGTYTFNVSDDNGCDIDTVVTVDEGAQIVITTSGVTNAACGGSNGAFTVEGTSAGVITLDINGIGVSNPYTDSTAVAGIYTVTATDASMCTITSTIQILNVSPSTLGVTANASATTVCNATSITLWGSSAINSDLVFTWDNSVLDSIAFPLPAGGYTYIVTGTDTTTGCQEQDTINITSTVQASLLTLATSSNSQSIAGTSCDAQMQGQGTTYDYTDNACALIATVTDGSGGNMLGNVQACVTVQGPVNVYNGQPYASRLFNILPQFQPAAGDSATVTLYYTNDDILDFNNFITSSGSSFPPFMSSGSLASPANGDVISNASITKFDDTLGLSSGAGYLYGVTLIYDATNMRWSATFKIPSFSFFFLHTVKPSQPGVGLNVDLVSLQGYKQGSTDVLAWTTINEKDMSHFNLLRGSLPTNMEPIANNIATKAPNGTSSKALNYQYIDNKPMVGHNYYKLEMVSKTGVVKTSDVVDIYWSVDGAQVAVYPNPADHKLNVDVNIARNTAAKIRIYDATGKLVRQVEAQLTKGLNSTVIELGDMAAGMYLIKVTDGKSLNYSQQFRKL